MRHRVQRAIFTAAGTLNRQDWGLTRNMPLDGGGLLVSTEIRIEIDLEACSSHDHSPACLATAATAPPGQALRPVLQRTRSKLGGDSAKPRRAGGRITL